MRRLDWFIAAAAAAPLILLLCLGHAGRGEARDSLQALLNTSQTVIGQPLAYPSLAPAKLTAVIVTMLPGEQTGWHRHDVPMFGYVLEGEVTVDYGAKGKRVYRQGDAVLEAVDWPHDGRNSGSGPARILAVFMGAEGVPNTVTLSVPASP